MGLGRHFVTAFRTLTTDCNALIHVANALTTVRTSVTNFCTKFAEMVTKMRAAQLQTGRGFTHFGAVQNEFEMVWLNVFSTHLQAMVHGCFKAGFTTG